MQIAAKTVMHKSRGVGTCLFCAQLIRSGDELLDHLRDKHKPEGYAVMVETLPGTSSNAWKGYTRYKVKMAGPCACGCGKMMIYPKGRYMPATPPPFYASGHRRTINTGTFPPGHEPANKGIRRPGWTNSGSFRRGHMPANYKGGIADNNGVVTRLVPGQKYPCGATVRVNVGREVGARIVGRPLRKSEVVYHKDGNYRNNDPGNIEVLERSIIINRTRALLLRGRHKGKRTEIVPVPPKPIVKKVEVLEEEKEEEIAFKSVRTVVQQKGRGLSLDHLAREEIVVPKKKRVKYQAPLPNAPRELWGTFCEKCRGLIFPNQPHRCK